VTLVRWQLYVCCWVQPSLNPPRLLTPSRRRRLGRAVPQPHCGPAAARVCHHPRTPQPCHHPHHPGHTLTPGHVHIPYWCASPVRVPPLLGGLRRCLESGSVEACCCSGSRPISAGEAPQSSLFQPAQVRVRIFLHAIAPPSMGTRPSPHSLSQALSSRITWWHQRAPSSAGATWACWRRRAGCCRRPSTGSSARWRSTPTTSC
jgi:hypothetical protein